MNFLFLKRGRRESFTKVHSIKRKIIIRHRLYYFMIKMLWKDLPHI